MLNEAFFGDFEKGRGFQPDFLLFLKDRQKQKLYYQVFIEPKGEQYKDESGYFEMSKEAWKNDFLLKIAEKYGDKNILKFETKEYGLIGLPLFNKNSKEEFEAKYRELYAEEKIWKSSNC